MLVAEWPRYCLSDVFYIPGKRNVHGGAFVAIMGELCGHWIGRWFLRKQRFLCCAKMPLKSRKWCKKGLHICVRIFSIVSRGSNLLLTDNTKAQDFFICREMHALRKSKEHKDGRAKTCFQRISFSTFFCHEKAIIYPFAKQSLKVFSWKPIMCSRIKK